LLARLASELLLTYQDLKARRLPQLVDIPKWLGPQIERTKTRLPTGFKNQVTVRCTKKTRS
jgi:hypothetical protein